MSRAGQSQAKSGDSNEFELKGAAGVVTKCGGRVGGGGGQEGGQAVAILTPKRPVVNRLCFALFLRERELEGHKFENRATTKRLNNVATCHKEFIATHCFGWAAGFHCWGLVDGQASRG